MLPSGDTLLACRGLAGGGDPGPRAHLPVPLPTPWSTSPSPGSASPTPLVRDPTPEPAPRLPGPPPDPPGPLPNSLVRAPTPRVRRPPAPRVRAAHSRVRPPTTRVHAPHYTGLLPHSPGPAPHSPSPPPHDSPVPDPNPGSIPPLPGSVPPLAGSAPLTPLIHALTPRSVPRLPDQPEVPATAPIRGSGFTHALQPGPSPTCPLGLSAPLPFRTDPAPCSPLGKSPQPLWVKTWQAGARSSILRGDLEAGLSVRGSPVCHPGPHRDPGTQGAPLGSALVGGEEAARVVFLPPPCAEGATWAG